LFCPKLKAGVDVAVLFEPNEGAGAVLAPKEGAGVVPAPKAGVDVVEPKAGAGVLVALEPKLKPVVL